MATPIAIVAYLALFSVVGFLFLFVNLVVGRLVRPSNPNEEKLEIYECGEPTIGSSFVQFDLRYYVVALLFLIFDVEIAFFFPWATVFGKVNHLANPALHDRAAVTERDWDREAAVAGLYAELGVPGTDPIVRASGPVIMEHSRKVARWTLADIGVFFVVLLVGFAYVWKRGDLDWVRSTVGQRQSSAQERGPPPAESQDAVLSA